MTTDGSTTKAESVMTQEREKRERDTKSAARNNLFSGMGGGLFGMLAMLFKMLLGGFDGLFGNNDNPSSKASLSSNVSSNNTASSSRSVFSGNANDFVDGLRGRGDRPLAQRNGPAPEVSWGNKAGASLRNGWDKVLDLIGQHESGGDYNRVYGKGVKRLDLTNMTINQVLEWQKRYTNEEGSASSAAGKYQIIRKTLTGLKDQMGLTGNEKFDQQMQDRMAMQLLENRGISKLKAGQMTTGEINKAINSISKEWASIEGANGRGAYDGDGLNRAAKGTGQKMAVALQNAVNGTDAPRTSLARSIDTQAPRTSGVSSEMTRVASVDKPSTGDGIAERQTVRTANGKEMFVGTYDGGTRTQIASVSPALVTAPTQKLEPVV